MKNDSFLYYFVHYFVHFLELVFIVLCFQYVYSTILDNCFLDRGIPVLVSICYYIVYAIVEYIFYKVKQLKKEVVVDEKKVD